MLRQIAYRSCTNLTSAAIHGDILRGLHPPSTCGLGTSVSSLAGTAHPQQCWLRSLAAAAHPFGTNGTLGGVLSSLKQLDEQSCIGGQPQGRHKQNPHELRHLSRAFVTDSKKIDEAEQDTVQYPIHRPDHVFVYQGPLSQTVSRLKVCDMSSACTASQQ